MVTDRDLRRFGIAARNPAGRRLLALSLADCSVEAVEWLLVATAREVGPHDAAAVATERLQDGSWREGWAAEQRRRAADEVCGMPRDRLEGLVACRVLADRRTVDQVAGEFGLDRDEVRRLVLRGAVRRGLTDDQVAEHLGLAAPSRRRSAEAFAEARARYGANTKPPEGRTAASLAATPPEEAARGAVVPAPAGPAPRPTPQAIAELYARTGRRAPAHVVAALTKERTP